MYIHGGGWFNLNKECYEYECSSMAKQSECVIFSIEYRMAIEGLKFPAPQEDAYAALLEIEKRASEYGADSSRMVVMGDSAGGQMAAAMCIMSRERKGPNIIAQILCYPCIGFDSNGGNDEPDSLVPMVFPIEGRERLMNEPYISPILDPKIAQTPPTMIAVGTCDFLLDDDLRYARRLLEAGVDVDFRLYQGMVHGFLHMGSAPGLKLLDHISQKLKEIYSKNN
jgi:acetyl esterase